MSAAGLSSALVLGLILIGNGATNPVAAQDSLRFEYAVKVLCGAPDRAAVAPGRYYTAINIHNPNPRTVAYRKKFALTSPVADSLVAPTAFNPPYSKLPSDYAVEVDCTNKYIQERRFAKGFAVIQSTAELDVVAVYTAVGATDRIATMHMERVPLRRMVPAPLR
jgi:hypothetical protein